jgi:hypothetical protein
LFFALGPARSPIASSLAMLVSLAVVPLVSLATRPSSAERLGKAFDGV